MIEALLALYIVIGLYTAQVGSTASCNGFIRCAVMGALWPLTWTIALLLFLSLPPD
jgi:hypothetical protein